MMSLRTIARAAPRSMSRLSSTAMRQTTRISQPSSLLRTSWATSTSPLRTSQLATFSSTPFRRAAESETDQELLAKLDSELQFENEMKDKEQLPASVKDFLDNSPFELKDEPGKQDVYLTRKMGNETISVSFTISDLANYEPDMYNEDGAMGDEDLEMAEGKEGEEDMGESEGEAAPPCRLNIVVEKPGQGALNIEALAQEGAIIVENFFYYKDAKMAHSTDPEAIHAAEDVYPGPPFNTLDEDLQIMMERYLEERGITQAMAVFVPDYMDVKESREYQTWLNNLKNFVEA
ncbi:mitochondrial glycoprotein [Xylariaceae sp. FL0255]|nr:mitochondrial glycoprotein [Xylariaceae sp. FL0255]